MYEVDKKLIDRIIRGDPSAEKDIVLHYHDYLAGFLKKFISNKQDQEDIIQETWLTVISKLRQGRFTLQGSSLKTYICSVAKNLWIGEKVPVSHNPHKCSCFFLASSQ